MATRIVFVAWSAIPALLLLFGQHRLFYALLGGLPDHAVSVLTGLANLSWYEVAYVIGSGLKKPAIFVAVPYVGIATAVLPAIALARPVWFRHAARVHAAAGLLIGGLALAVLAWRTVRGFGDPWRLATTVAFVSAHAGWLLHSFWRTAPAAEPRLALQA